MLNADPALNAVAIFVILYFLGRILGTLRRMEINGRAGMLASYLALSVD